MLVHFVSVDFQMGGAFERLINVENLFKSNSSEYCFVVHLKHWVIDRILFLL